MDQRFKIIQESVITFPNGKSYKIYNLDDNFVSCSQLGIWYEDLMLGHGLTSGLGGALTLICKRTYYPIEEEYKTSLEKAVIKTGTGVEITLYNIVPDQFERFCAKGMYYRGMVGGVSNICQFLFMLQPDTQQKSNM